MILVTYITIVSETAALIYSLVTGLNIAWAGIIHRLDIKSLAKRAGASLLVFLALCVIPAFVYLKFSEATHIMDYWKWDFRFNEFKETNFDPLHLGAFSSAAQRWDWCLQEGVRWGLNICLVSSVVLLLYVSLAANRMLNEAWSLKTISIPHFARIGQAAGIGHVLGLAVMILGTFSWLIWIVGIVSLLLRPIKTVKFIGKCLAGLFAILIRAFTR